MPNALITSASGINDNGIIVGYYEDTAGLHGFVLTGEEYVALDVSFVGANNTIALGVNNRGRIVGTYQNSAGIHGFTYYDGIYSTIAVPGALDTTPTGINRGKWWASTTTASALTVLSRHRNARSASQTTLRSDFSFRRDRLEVLCGLRRHRTKTGTTNTQIVDDYPDLYLSWINSNPRRTIRDHSPPH